MHEIMREHLIRNLSEGLRLDGRGLTQYRPIVIETGISKTAEGSAKVMIGDTVVIAGVKLALEKPYPDTADQGNLMVNAELSPLSSPTFESGPPTAESIELARVTDRGIRESHMIDVKKLCVEVGEKVWSVSVDICPINHAGNLLDAASLAAVAALNNAVFPSVGDDGKVDYKNKTDKKIPLENLPLSVTVHKVGDYLLLDLTVSEETHTDARLTVCSTEDGNICALQKGGSEALSLDEIFAMVDMAVAQAKESRKNL